MQEGEDKQERICSRREDNGIGRHKQKETNGALRKKGHHEQFNKMRRRGPLNWYAIQTDHRGDFETAKIHMTY